MSHLAVFIPYDAQMGKASQIAKYVARYSNVNFVSITASSMATRLQYDALPNDVRALFGKNSVVQDANGIRRMIVSWDQIFASVDTDSETSDIYSIVLMEDAEKIQKNFMSDTSMASRLSQLALGEYIFDCRVTIISDTVMSSQVKKFLNQNGPLVFAVTDAQNLPGLTDNTDS